MIPSSTPSSHMYIEPWCLPSLSFGVPSIVYIFTDELNVGFVSESSFINCSWFFVMLYHLLVDFSLTLILRSTTRAFPKCLP